ASRALDCRPRPAQLIGACCQLQAVRSWPGKIRPEWKGRQPLLVEEIPIARIAPVVTHGARGACLEHAESREPDQCDATEPARFHRSVTSRTARTRGSRGH